MEIPDVELYVDSQARDGRNIVRSRRMNSWIGTPGKMVLGQR